uniref:methylated-DNA--[protein]-cysteine S-methyltransferase n=1 Tax=Magnetococcus massalia (strain MO-1) TaxID=451514 RepID=A0A1S7LNA8_MAGMO|nr:Putative methylated-DNA--protein-cysteine methyltransferase [Candidatus Magnetococcus massalia]
MLWLEIRQGTLVSLSWSLPETMQDPQEDTELVQRICCWLDDYFSRKVHLVDFPLRPEGTVFQQSVWRAMSAIPLGQTATYGDIAKQLNSSARAVGTACGQNPIPIIIPCHRVTGAHDMGGYSGHGGLTTKRLLLGLEGAMKSEMKTPYRQAS